MLSKEDCDFKEAQRSAYLRSKMDKGKGIGHKLTGHKLGEVKGGQNWNPCQNHEISFAKWYVKCQLSFQENAEAVDPLLQADSIHIVRIEEPKDRDLRMRHLKVTSALFWHHRDWRPVDPVHNDATGELELLVEENPEPWRIHLGCGTALRLQIALCCKLFNFHYMSVLLDAWLE